MKERQSPARPRVSDQGVPRRHILAGAGLAAAAGLLNGCGTPNDAASDERKQRRIVKVFDDAVLELGRLLKEAAEIEHDLMVQYLYAAFSLKPAYAELTGYGAPTAKDVLGVAIQEMQHLHTVNELLRDLGLAPVLSRHDFPEEVNIYPFPFRLEPMSRKSLAKYVYCEAPLDALISRSVDDDVFLQEMKRALGADPRPNHVGSLYDSVISSVRDVASKTDILRDPDGWITKLQRIKGEGEQDHYHFFRTLFMSRHPLFRQHGDVWRLLKTDPRYPSYDLPVDQTAYPGHPNSIVDPATRTLAWLGNLTYWLTLALLDLGYRGHAPNAPIAAQSLMQGPLVAIARALPPRGGAVAFDPLSMGASPGADRRRNLALAGRIAQEAISVAKGPGIELPPAFSMEPIMAVAENLDTWSRRAPVVGSARAKVASHRVAHERGRRPRVDRLGVGL